MKLLHTLRDDVRAVFERDPAARTLFEVILSYPVLHALWSHRAAHWLWTHRLKLAGQGLLRSKLESRPNRLRLMTPPGCSTPRQPA